MAAGDQLLLSTGGDSLLLDSNAADVLTLQAEAIAADWELPDPRFEMPELLLPGRKPVGPVAIDWNHPAAKDVKVFVMFSGGVQKEIVNSGTSDGTQGVREGSAVKLTNTQFDEVPIPIDVINNYDGYSAMWVGRGRTVPDSNGGYWYIPATGPVNCMGVQRDGTTNELVSRHGDGAGPKFNLTTDRGDLYDETHSLTLTSRNVDKILEYRDGVLIGSELTATGTNQSASAGVVYINSDKSGLNENHQDFECLVLWQRVISPNEVASLARDPYQFLIPA